MVNFPRLSTLPLVALGVLTSQVTAAPTVAGTAEVTTRFSFSEWVDSIIADPSTALSPEEAVQAYLDTANATLPATAAPRSAVGMPKYFVMKTMEEIEPRSV